MSYDVSIEIDTGGEHPTDVEEVGNMTSNVGGMYYHAMPSGGYEDRGGVPGLNGMSCEWAIPVLRAALVKFDEDEKHLRTMEPDNGWGDYDSALKFLRAIFDACKRHPLASVRVSF